MQCWHGLLCAKYSGTLPPRMTKESIPLYTAGGRAAQVRRRCRYDGNHAGENIFLQSKCLRALCAPAIKDGERSLVIKHRWSSDDA